MSREFKKIIPLLNDKITKEDISEKAGFIDAFTDDINRPYLDSHIFLMYDYENKMSNEAIKRAEKFANALQNKPKITKINGKWYAIYTFKLTTITLLSYKIHNHVSMEKNDKMKLINFWGTTDDEINNFVIYDEGWEDEYPKKTIPEEDYVEEMSI